VGLVEGARVGPLDGVPHGGVHGVDIWLERHRLRRGAGVRSPCEASIVQELRVSIHVRKVSGSVKTLTGVELLEQVTSLTCLTCFHRGGQGERDLARLVLREVLGHGVLKIPYTVRILVWNWCLAKFC